MWEDISQFWRDNSASIMVSLIVGFVFFVLGPLGLWFSGKRIRRERIRKAKETLIDLLERMVVKQAQADEAKLKSVFRAVERDIDIDLSGEYHLDHWLGDVVLRFERSRHLSADQKQQYYDSVRRIYDEIHAKTDQKPRVESPRKYEAVLNDLKNALATNEVSRAVSTVDELERTLSQRERSQDPLLNVLRIYQRLYQRNPVTFFVALTTVLAAYVYIIFRFLLR